MRDASLKLTYGVAEFFHCCAKVSSDTSDKQQPLCHFRVCAPVDDFLQKKKQQCVVTLLCFRVVVGERTAIAVPFFSVPF
ncbi:MAG: hypothetical protein ACK45R_05645 [Candidatus Kapaibacterium sp.]